VSWFLVFLGFCFLILLHEAGHFVAAKATGMRVEGFYLFFGPTLWSFRRGETEYGVKSIPLGGYVKINGMNPEEEMPPGHEHRAYHRQKVWKRIVVAAAGPAVNIALAFVILYFVFSVGGLSDQKPVVAETKAGSAAAGVLEKGDLITSINGRSFAGLTGSERINKISEIVTADKCPGRQIDGCAAKEPVELTVRRDGQLKTFRVTPHYDAKEKRMLVGFGWDQNLVWEPISNSEALSHSTGVMGEVITRTGSVFSHIFESEKRKEISSVVGISDVGHEAVDNGWRQSLLLLALVSLSLGLINLLPILPLDGGHIFWAIVEKLRGGKPVSVRVMERATIIGFALVLMIMAIGVSNDIGRITGEGFNVSK
jgi:regulator of sigma E protease